MKPLIITFELVEKNGVKYLFIPSDQWMLINCDEKNIILTEKPIGVRQIAFMNIEE